MRFVTLQSNMCCECPDGNCKYDFGCSSMMTCSVETPKQLATFLSYGGGVVHDVADVVTLINKMRDIKTRIEPQYSEECIQEFLGEIDQHKVEKILFVDQGEDMLLCFPLIERNVVELITHPNNILRQLVG